MCLQETRLTPDRLIHAKTAFRDIGYDMLLGKQPNNTKFKRLQTNMHRQANGGVATISFQGLPTQTYRLSEELAPYVLGTWNSSHSGCQGFYLFNVYLPSGKPNIKLRAQIMEQLLEEVAPIRNFPLLICGDFQEDPDANKMVHNVLFAGEFVDVVKHFDEIQGRPRLHTYARSGFSNSKAQGRAFLDTCLANNVAFPLVKNAYVEQNIPVPNHAAIVVDLDLVYNPQQSLRRVEVEFHSTRVSECHLS